VNTTIFAILACQAMCITPVNSHFPEIRQTSFLRLLLNVRSVENKLLCNRCLVANGLALGLEFADFGHVYWLEHKWSCAAGVFQSSPQEAVSAYNQTILAQLADLYFWLSAVRAAFIQLHILYLADGGDVYHIQEAEQTHG
jgi:hypothetical protein